MIDKAHGNGFEVTLLYVALRDENLAIKRVEDRVQKGGHGVPSEIIKNVIGNQIIIYQRLRLKVTMFLFMIIVKNLLLFIKEKKANNQE